MLPTEVVHMHADFVRRMREERLFREVVTMTFTSDLSMALHGDRSDQGDRDELERTAQGLTDALAVHAEHATTYQVSKEMMPLLVAMTEGLDATDKWNSSLAPTPTGFVRFETPVTVVDVHNKELKAHWLIWGPVPHHKPDGSHGTGTVLVWFNDSADPDHYSIANFMRDSLGTSEYEALVSVIGRWAWVAGHFIGNGRELGKMNISFMEQALLVSDGEESEEITEQELANTNLPRYAHALWLMLNQTITLPERHRAERHAFKRARRMNLPGEVTVIRLRRTVTSYKTGQGRAVEWQHSWVVRGHWRWQPCGPNYPGAQQANYLRGLHPDFPFDRSDYYARIWINAFPKGPEDKPLVVTKKINRLDR